MSKSFRLTETLDYYSNGHLFFSLKLEIAIATRPFVVQQKITYVLQISTELFYVEENRVCFHKNLTVSTIFLIIMKSLIRIYSEEEMLFGCKDTRECTSLIMLLFTELQSTLTKCAGRKAHSSGTAGPHWNSYADVFQLMLELLYCQYFERSSEHYTYRRPVLPEKYDLLHDLLFTK